MPFLAQDAVFKRPSEIAEVSSLSKEERREYDESLKHYRDTIAVMHGQFLEGLEKGIEQGRAEGEAKGRKDERLAIAQGMKASGMPVDMIARYTGLTADEIAGL